MTEPVTLEEGRAYLRLDATGDPPAHEDDALVTTLIKAAREDVEAGTGRRFVDAALVDAWDDFPCELWLDGYPVKSVDALKYVATDETETTLDPSLYRVDLTRPRARISPAWGVSWPTALDVPSAVKVQYTVGPSGEVPASIKAAILRRLTELYENRNTAEKPDATVPGYLTSMQKMVRI